jgi:hypothetical protein
MGYAKVILKNIRREKRVEKIDKKVFKILKTMGT